jgi:hypothetical protein
MSKKQRPTDRDTVFEQVRSLLAETYDCGIALCSWEEQGTTYHAYLKFGNDYAAEKLTEKANEIIFPIETEEDEDEEEEA